MAENPKRKYVNYKNHVFKEEHEYETQSFVPKVDKSKGWYWKHLGNDIICKYKENNGKVKTNATVISPAEPVARVIVGSVTLNVELPPITLAVPFAPTAVPLAPALIYFIVAASIPVATVTSPVEPLERVTAGAAVTTVTVSPTATSVTISAPFVSVIS